MLSRERAEQILTLHEAGFSVSDIAERLGHSPATVRGYINGHRTPGARAPRPSLLTDRFARYCRQRFAEDPHLRPSTLFTEVTELGFPGSRATFYRELAQRQLPPNNQQPGMPEIPAKDAAGTHRPAERIPVLPRPTAPITGETLASFLTRLAQANQLTLPEVIASLPPWFTTKINNRDDRAQHHMLNPATAQALRALSRLASTTPAGLARALPAFGATDTHGPLRATTACPRCAARHGIHQPEPIPVHLPIHHKICTRHGLWLSDFGQPHLDLNTCPEIITAQRRATRLLRRYTSQQLSLAHQTAIGAIAAWPASPADVPSHWRYRLLILQTSNQHRDLPTDHDTYTHAAIYPDAITLAATILGHERSLRIKQDPMAKAPPVKAK
jgi:hypothetical protein